MTGHDRRRGSDALIAHRGAGRRSSHPVPTSWKQLSPPTERDGPLRCVSCRRAATNSCSAQWTMSCGGHRRCRNGHPGEHRRYRRHVNPVCPDGRRLGDPRVSRRRGARSMPRANTNHRTRERWASPNGRPSHSHHGTLQSHRVRQSHYRATLRHGRRCCRDRSMGRHHDQPNHYGPHCGRCPHCRRCCHDCSVSSHHAQSRRPADRAIPSSFRRDAIRSPPCHSSRSV